MPDYDHDIILTAQQQTELADLFEASASQEGISTGIAAARAKLRSDPALKLRMNTWAERTPKKILTLAQMLHCEWQVLDILYPERDRCLGQLADMEAQVRDILPQLGASQLSTLLAYAKELLQSQSEQSV